MMLHFVRNRTFWFLKKKQNTRVLQIPLEKVFRHSNPAPKPLAEGIGASGDTEEASENSNESLIAHHPSTAFWKRGTCTSRENFSRSLMMTISQTTTTVSASRTLRCFGTFFLCVCVCACVLILWKTPTFLLATGTGFRGTVDRKSHRNLSDVADQSRQNFPQVKFRVAGVYFLHLNASRV